MKEKCLGRTQELQGQQDTDVRLGGMERKLPTGEGACTAGKPRRNSAQRGISCEKVRDQTQLIRTRPGHIKEFGVFILRAREAINRFN